MAEQQNELFTLKGIIGHNPKVPVLNLTIEQQEVIIALAAANVVTIYNMQTNENHHLLSHILEIESIHCDCSGRFLLTTDSSCCIVWDRKMNPPYEIRLLTMSQANPQKENASIVCTALSDDAKYIVLATENVLELWAWCTFNTKPDGQYKLPTSDFGKLKSIRGRPHQSNCFVVTMQNGLVFIQFREGKLYSYSPKSINGAKSMHDSCFVDDHSRGITVTDQGNAVVWGDTQSESQDFNMVIENIVLLKMVSLSKHPLTSICNTDGVILTADDSGEVRFYSPELRILFWTKCLQSDFVLSVSFNLNPRKYRFKDSAEQEIEQNDEIDIFNLEDVSRDSTFERNPFIVRKFIASTRTGKIIICDIVRSTAEQVLFTASSDIETFDAHPSKSIVCGGATDGRLFLYDFDKQMTVTDQNISTFVSNTVVSWSEERHNNCAIKAIRYSYSGDHLLCAVGNGYIWMLDPIVARPIKLLHFSKNEIVDIQFSSRSNLFAYYDVENTVVFCEYQNMRWQTVGKHCVHILPITVLIFAVNDTRLVTCADDRFTTQYDVDQSLIDRTLVVLQCSRNEQTSQIHCGCLFGENRILTTGAHLKFKLWDTQCMELRHTFVAPFTDGIIKHLQIVGDASSQSSDGSSFLMYSTDNKVIGLHLLPMDGNMFKHRGMMCHPRSIKTFKVLADKVHMLTLGHLDRSIFAWKIDPSIVVDQYHAGGTGLSAFCKALPGGHQGWLLKQMLDVFYYLQILGGTQNSIAEHSVSDRLAVADVKHFMQAIGYFGTEFEMDNLLKEIAQNDPEETTIGFDELVRLYINHRPVFGYSREKIEEAVRKCAESMTEDSEEALRHPKNQVLLDRDHLLTVCTTKGEPMSRFEVAQCFAILLHKEQIDQAIIGKNPDTIAERYIQETAEVFSVKDFMHEMLGLENE